MNNKNQTLEERGKEETLDTVRCYYCDKEIKRGEAWYSHGGLPYCNKMCFYMFTED